MLSEEKIGVVLAGGSSRRFGEPKAFSPFKDKPMYQWAVETIHPLVGDTVIVSHSTLVERFKEECTESVFMDEEKFRGCGPLAGIYTAMKKRPAEWYYVIPCDTPCVTIDVYQILEENIKNNKGNVQGAVPFFNGKLHPLVSIFHRSLLPRLEELLTNDLLRMTDFIDSAPIIKIEMSSYFTDNPFVNVNTKAELQAIEGQTRN